MNSTSSHSPTEPAGNIVLTENPRFIPGYVYGIQESALRVSIFINELCWQRLDLLHDQLARVWPDIRLPAILPHSEREARSVIETVVACIRHALLHARIPVSELFHVEEVNYRRNGAQCVIYLPASRPQACARCIATLIKLANHSSTITSANNTASPIGKLREQLDADLALHSWKGQNYFLLVTAARQIGLPILRLDPQQLIVGIGTSRLEFDSTITAQTSKIGISLARDKWRCAQFLRESALPAPTHVMVKNEEEAVRTAESLRFPVVVKPADLDGGQGVYANVADFDTVRWAYRRAAALSKRVLVERHCLGVAHRLTVINGRVLKATRKTPLSITGDGIRSIQALVEQLPQSTLGTGTTEWRTLDEEAVGLLRQLGYAREDIPGAGVVLPLRRRSNSAAGGHTEVLPLGSIHADNLALGRRVASLFGLDFVGIDLITSSLSDSWMETECVICDVNAQPQCDADTLRAHLARCAEEMKEVPVHLVVGDEVSLPTIWAHVEETATRMGCNGVATLEGVKICGEKVSRRLQNSFQAAYALLLDPRLQSGIVVMGLNEVHALGLPWPNCQSIRVELGSPISDAEKNALITKIKPHTKTLKANW